MISKIFTARRSTWIISWIKWFVYMWKRAIKKVTKLRRTDQVQVEIRIIVFFMNVYIVSDAVFLYLTLCKCN